VAPLLPADLERPFLPMVATSDASPAFGFGVSVRSCPIDCVHEPSSLSERHGDFIRTAEDIGTESRFRVGRPVGLPLSMDSFTDVLSTRASRKSHSGAMEAQALLLLVQWVLRSSLRFGKRLIVGIDAKAVLSAALKGRSSAPSHCATMRSVAAHCLCGDLLLYPLYIPSEFNPADAPSRGIRRRPLVR
jgi:hypothetical protein